MSLTHTPTGSAHRLRQAFSAACRLTGPLQVKATHRGSGHEQMFVIRRPYATVGRGASSEIRLDDPSVSRPHAFLQVVEGQVYCTDLGSQTGLVWEDGRRGQGWLGGDQIARVGVFDLQVINPAPPAVRRLPGSPPDEGDRSGASQPVPSLEVYRGTDSPIGVCPLDWPVTLVGRHPSCRLRFVDSTVDYFQGCVVNTPDSIWWIDFSRRRPGLVNGQRARLARLRYSDMLEIGRVTLVPRKAEAVPNYPDDESLVKLTATTAMVPPPDEAVVSTPAVAAMMAELRQCVTAMAQTFTALQQEHAATVNEHLMEIRELTRELRHLRGSGGGGAVVPPQPLPARSPRPTPAPTVSPDADRAALTDAHTWFLGQLANLGQPTASAPKRRG